VTEDDPLPIIIPERRPCVICRCTEPEITMCEMCTGSHVAFNDTEFVVKFIEDEEK
jgi:hypothetical protein